MKTFHGLKDQPVSTIYKVEEQSPGHFYWPDIDIDLTESIIENPDRYPLKVSSHNKPLKNDAE